MFVKEIPLKEVGRENYELKIIDDVAVSEDFKRWGLCNECEQRLTGRSSTPKPRNLICLGCVQVEKRSMSEE